MTIDQNDTDRRHHWATEICGLLADLDPLEREAVTLSYFRRLSTQEISRVMSLPVSAVRTAVAGGLGRLAVALAAA